MGKHLRLTIYVLLLALVCSLGDGPFVDEVMADERGEQTVQLQPSEQTDASSQDSLVIVYATLMNAGLGAQCAPPLAQVVTAGVPAYRALAYSPPKLSLPDKPPRFQV